MPRLLTKTQQAERLVAVAGDSVARMLDPQNGWPSHIEVAIEGEWREAELFVGSVGTMSRGIDYEYRFQNPGQNRPIRPSPGLIPILAGYTEDSGHPICVGGDVRKRIGSTARFSVLFHGRILAEAALSGWGEYTSSVGETIIAFHPKLLPLFVQMEQENLVISEITVTATVQDTGGIDQDDESAIERLRRATSRLVRDSRFSGLVLTAYKQHCAACGINKNLVEAAHIYPAAAPESPDTVWNGLALCANHHRLFDTHRMFIAPDDLRISIHPSFLENLSPIEETFIESTYDQLAVPVSNHDRPRPEMFVRRYEREDKVYAWAR